jgi:hypothetical protein
VWKLQVLSQLLQSGRTLSITLDRFAPDKEKINFLENLIQGFGRVLGKLAFS